MSNEEMAPVQVTRRYNYPADQVFAEWFEPTRLGQWLFATSTTMVVQYGGSSGEGPKIDRSVSSDEPMYLEVDPRVGGGFSFTQRVLGEDWRHRGTYVEISRPNHIAYDWSIPKFGSSASRVTVDIRPLGSGCELTVTSGVCKREVAAHACKMNWAAILEDLAEVLARSETPKTEDEASMHTVRVTRRYNFSAERVFDAWLDPSRLGKWFFATATGEMVWVEVDARVGGNFNITERRGGEDVPHIGTYVEIDRPRRLVFDVSVPKYAQRAERVTIEFAPVDSGCELTLTHETSPRKDVTPDILHTGWTMILDGLAKVLSGAEKTTASAGAPLPTARVMRHIKASPERVFDAWLDPELLGQWMFGPNVREEEILHLKVNPMVGGSFSFLVRRGDAEIDHIGEYLEIDRPRKLVFTWGVRQEEGTEFSRVTIEIAAAGDGSELTITHEMGAKWADFVERAQSSWQLMAGALARVLE